MKNRSILKRIFCICIIAVLAVGCGKKEDATVGIIDKENKEEQVDLSKDKFDDAEEETLDEEEQPTKQLPVYCLEEETLERISVTELIYEDTEITPELIVDIVVGLFADSSFPLEIGIDSVTVEKDAAIVSFTGDTPPIMNVGTSVEAGILDCISMSILDNVQDCQKVIFRVKGEAYSTGHMIFGVDEPYKTLNKNK